MDSGNLDFPPDLLERAAAETAAFQGEVANAASGITLFIAHVADRAALLRKCLIDIPELVVIVGGAWQGMHGWNPMLGKGRDTARAQWAAWCASVVEPFPATYDYFINFVDGAALANNDSVLALASIMGLLCLTIIVITFIIRNAKNTRAELMKKMDIATAVTWSFFLVNSIRLQQDGMAPDAAFKQNLGIFSVIIGAYAYQSTTRKPKSK